MPSNKNHHYVPQFLLRQFGSGTNHRQICVFRVAGARHVRGASIKQQCSRDWMYGKHGRAEHFLGHIESETANAVRHIVATETVPEPFTDAIRFLYVFVMLQWSRTPAAVARQEEAHSQLFQQMAKTHPKYTDELRSYIERVRVRSHSALSDGMKFALKSFPMLQDLRLKVLRNDSPIEFFIGDAPVVMHNQWCRALDVGSTGLACSGLQIFMPLSPRHLALFYDTDIYHVGESPVDVVGISEPAEVLSVNALQFAAARECVYYRSEQMARYFQEFEDKLRMNPLGVRADRFKEEGGQSHLLVVQNMALNVDVRVSVVRVRDEMRLVRKHERANRFRPEAMQMAEKLDPELSSAQGRGGPRPGAAFRRVKD